MTPIPPSEGNKVAVRMGVVDSVNIYQVKENELEILEHGSPGGIYLNFSIFLLSIAASAIVALCTSKFRSPKFETAFICVFVAGSLGGIFLLILWGRTHKSVSSVIKKIRDRIPPEQSDPDEPEPSSSAPPPSGPTAS